MKFPWGPFPLRPACLGAVAAALCCFAAHVGAAVLRVHVTDPAGRSLPNAVVMLEPVSAKLPPVEPMAGVAISQAKRQFNPQVTVVTVGTPVHFPNFDTVRHHVYSFSPAKHFELKLYAGVPAKPVVFDKPGVAVIGCNIHDNMVAWVVIVDTPLYAMTATGGRAKIASVPAGAYQLKVWHASLRPGVEMSSIPVNMGTSDQEVQLQVQGTAP